MTKSRRSLAGEPVTPDVVWEVLALSHRKIAPKKSQQYSFRKNSLYRRVLNGRNLPYELALGVRYLCFCHRVHVVCIRVVSRILLIPEHRTGHLTLASNSFLQVRWSVGTFVVMGKEGLIHANHLTSCPAELIDSTAKRQSRLTGSYCFGPYLTSQSCQDTLTFDHRDTYPTTVDKTIPEAR